MPRADGGTRGSTPGSYVERYMAREDATSAVYPLSGERIDYFVGDYMSRDGDRATHGPTDGVAFSAESISMSADEVHKASKEMQELFDAGHTVIKTVISFTDEYLKETGAMEPDFVSRHRGDKVGHVDQTKLRLAVQRGMERLSRGFDDLRWIAVAQFDTMHVHVHVAMVDAGFGRLRDDGEQKGCLSKRDMTLLRRGIDSSLTAGKNLHPFSKEVSVQRTRVRSLVSQVALSDVAREDKVRLILASLPENKNMWRAGSHAREMRVANRMAREYVREVMRRPSSAWSDVLSSISAYAEARGSREGLSRAEVEDLVADGVAMVEDGCVNALYATLRDVERQGVANVSPAMASILRETDDVEVPASPMSEMTYRVRAYSRRLEEHRQLRNDFHGARVAYEAASSVSPASVAAFRYYVFEERYQEMCMAKYQHMLPVAAWGMPWREEVRSYLDDYRELEAYRQALLDPAVRTLDVRAAEVWGRERYGIDGCGLMVSAPNLFMDRLQNLASSVEHERSELEFRLSGAGLSFEFNGEALVARVRQKPAHDFEDVKMLDLHDMTHDFDHDVQIPMGYVHMFSDMAKERQELYDGACDYFRDTGQADVISALPGRDVLRMSSFAASLDERPVMTTARTSAGSSSRGELRMQHGIIRTGLDAPATDAIEYALQDIVISDLGI